MSMGLIEQFAYNDNGILYSCEEDLLCAGVELSPDDVYYYCYNSKR